MMIPTDAACPECGTPLTETNADARLEDIADAPDGLPAPVLLLICKQCRQRGEAA